MKNYAEGVGIFSGLVEWIIPPVSFITGLFLFYWWLLVPPIISAVMFFLMSGGYFVSEKEKINQLNASEKRKMAGAFSVNLVQAILNTLLINGFLFGIGVVISFLFIR